MAVGGVSRRPAPCRPSPQRAGRPRTRRPGDCAAGRAAHAGSSAPRHRSRCGCRARRPGTRPRPGRSGRRVWRCAAPCPDEQGVRILAGTTACCAQSATQVPSTRGASGASVIPSCPPSVAMRHTDLVPSPRRTGSRGEWRGRVVLPDPEMTSHSGHRPPDGSARSIVRDRRDGRVRHSHPVTLCAHARSCPEPVRRAAPVRGFRRARVIAGLLPPASPSRRRRHGDSGQGRGRGLQRPAERLRDQPPGPAVGHLRRGGRHHRQPLRREPHHRPLAKISPGCRRLRSPSRTPRFYQHGGLDLRGFTRAGHRTSPEATSRCLDPHAAVRQDHLQENALRSGDKEAAQPPPRRTTRASSKS